MSERHTISHIRRMLEAAGLKPRHDLGQNFLVDLNLLDVIIAAAEVRSDDVVLEVGTGTGSLTAQLAERAGHVVAVEYDPQMARLTEMAVAGHENVTLLNQDALRNKNNLADKVLEALSSAMSPRPRFGAEGASVPNDPNRNQPEASARDDQPSTLTRASGSLKSSPVIDPPLFPEAGTRGQSQSTLKLVANLPYHAATPIISNLIATELPWSRMVVTVQLELAERMTAKPQTPDYSALSVWLQSQCKIEILRKLPPDVFWPKPKVDSAIVQLDRDLDRQAMIKDRAAFQSFLRDIFTQRRKHLIGVVARLLSDQIDRAALEAIHAELGWPTTIRAEELSVDEFVAYHNKLITRENC